MSGHEVYRVRLPGGRGVYLKVASGMQRAELEAEHERLHWLRGRLPVPEVLAFTTEGDQMYLLVTELPGVMSCDATVASDVPAVVRLLAAGLRQIHAVPIAQCPFDARLAVKLAVARQRLRAGMVDLSALDESRQGIGADELEALLDANCPPAEDVVFTHGDYCLPNVLLDPTLSHVTGFVDLGRAGIADRYQDLALAVRSLAHNFGPGWESYLWDAYGIAQPDRDKVAFYQLLDEFF